MPRAEAFERRGIANSASNVFLPRDGEEEGRRGGERGTGGLSRSLVPGRPSPLPSALPRGGGDKGDEEAKLTFGAGNDDVAFPESNVRLVAAVLLGIGETRGLLSCSRHLPMLTLAVGQTLAASRLDISWGRWSFTRIRRVFP